MQFRRVKLTLIDDFRTSSLPNSITYLYIVNSKFKTDIEFYSMIMIRSMNLIGESHYHYRQASDVSPRQVSWAATLEWRWSNTFMASHSALLFFPP